MTRKEEDDNDRRINEALKWPHEGLHKNTPPWPAILVYNGSFNPIHKGHIRVLELSRQALLDSGMYHVLGTFLMTTHNDGLRRKFPKEPCYVIDSRHRNEMVRLALNEAGDAASWAVVDEWQGLQITNPGAARSTARLHELVQDIAREKYSHPNDTFLPNVEIVSIVGADQFYRLLHKAEKGAHVVCVQNRSEGAEIDLRELSSKCPHVTLVHDPDWPEVSSTLARRLISSGCEMEGCAADVVGASVLRYHRENGITYSVDQCVRDASVSGGSKTDHIEIDVNTDTLLPSSKIEWNWLRPFGFSDVLGEGKQSVVKASSIGEAPVAVKIFKCVSNKAKDTRRMITSFEHELQALQSMTSHPNIVQCLGSGIDPVYFFVLEKLDYTLFEWWNTLHLETSSIEGLISLMCVARDVAAGASHMHSCGVVHRDLTIENLLILDISRKDGKQGAIVKISDFGVAGILGSEKCGVRGSMRHFAPEAINKIQAPKDIKACEGYYRTASDVFMFAAMMYEMLYLGKPGGDSKGSFWSGETISQAVQHTLADERPIIPNECDDTVIGKAYSSIITKAWKQQASDRPAMKDIYHEISRITNDYKPKDSIASHIKCKKSIKQKMLHRKRKPKLNCSDEVNDWDKYDDWECESNDSIKEG